MGVGGFTFTVILNLFQDPIESDMWRKIIAVNFRDICGARQVTGNRRRLKQVFDLNVFFDCCKFKVFHAAPFFYLNKFIGLCNTKMK